MAFSDFSGAIQELDCGIDTVRRSVIFSFSFSFPFFFLLAGKGGGGAFFPFYIVASPIFPSYY